MHMTNSHAAVAGRKFAGLFGAPAASRPWFEPTPLRALFTHMLTRRRPATTDSEDRTGYDPSMMGLS